MGARFSSWKPWNRLAAVALAAGLAGGAAGCPAPERPRATDQVVSAHHSLEEIGEIAFAAGERAEEQGRWREAFAAYARAEWAFEYHRRLTDREPALLAAATDACERLRERWRRTRAGDAGGGGR